MISGTIFNASDDDDGLRRAFTIRAAQLLYEELARLRELDSTQVVFYDNRAILENTVEINSFNKKPPA